MAVAQAYGKTVTSGSVFAYDVADTRNSYKGEPTVNIVSSPQFTSFTNVTVGDASIIKTDFGGGRIGIQMTQVATSNIVTFTVPLTTSTLTSGGTYTLSSEIESTKTGALVKSQVTVQVNGVTYWLTNSNTWTTTVTESSHLFNSSQTGVNHKVTTTFTMPVGTLTNFTLGGFYRVTSNFTLKIANVQFEAKSHATPFVAGTRSATQGLLPLVGNSTIDLTNVSFDSNAQIVFDGTNDFVSCGAIQPFDLSTRTTTWEAVVKFNNTSVEEAIITRWDDPTGNRVWLLGRSSTGKIQVYLIIDGSPYDYYSEGTIGATVEYYHITVTLDGTKLRYYINGTLDSTSDIASGTWTSDPDPLLIIGAQNQGVAGNLNGEIPVVKLYNRVLTASEIKQNFRHYRTRFGMEYDTFYFAVSNKAARYNQRWAEREPIFDEEDNFTGEYTIIAEGEISGENMASTTPAYTLYRKPNTSFQNPGAYIELASDNIGTPARLTQYGVQTTYSSGKWLTTVTVRKNNATGELSFEFPDGNTDTYGEAFYKTIITPYVP